MSTVPCYNNKEAAQTLFLGASVSSFNTSMGWGSQASQLTVNLVEDDNHTECHVGAPITLDGNVQSQFPSAGGFGIDHYNTCIGDNCYINALDGSSFNPSLHKIENKIIPGKVYYKIYGNGFSKAIGSNYWTDSDPGFFGMPTRILNNGTYFNGPAYSVPTNNRGYDIIDTPVYFKMGDFSFGGLVQSWSRSISNGGKSYAVIINSMQSLLSSCHIILDNFAGSIFSKSLYEDPSYGAPRNYTKSEGVIYGGSIAAGNLPNIFNVYGFLESLGRDGFGGSGKNKDGLPANKIVDAITVLTSANDDGDLLSRGGNTKYASKVAFSPFGRILSKCMQEQDNYIPISSAFNSFGVVPPSNLVNPVFPTARCQFSLDLSELPRTPDSFRLTGPVMSILDLINTISEQTGHDFYIQMIPVQYKGVIHNILKVKTISRLKQPRTNLIENTIKTFECGQYHISATTLGKEKNDTNARSVIIGGAQQRLYQAKSYRLAYTQANYVFNPATFSFIDYMQLGGISNQVTRTGSSSKQFHYGKIKFPNFLSTRNPLVNEKLNPDYYELLNDDDILQNNLEGQSFSTNDTLWSDEAETQSLNTARAAGNYYKTIINKQEQSDRSTWGFANNQRFFPLYRDVICPFFGFTDEGTSKLPDDEKNLKNIRPVWFDTWTGQSLVMVQTSELPLVSVPLLRAVSLMSDGRNTPPPYKTSAGITYFVVSESEIRAALAGFDSYIVYCLAKTFKPDLIEMLRRGHIDKDRLRIFQNIQHPLKSAQWAEERASVRHNWYWQIQSGNIGLDGDLYPGKADGAGNLPESVMRDIKILHTFVASLGVNYGKKYMVSAYGVQSYRDDKNADIVLPTQIGNAYIFSGGGSFIYNYTPTNDGAWEEYGNIIDDTVLVGSSLWNTLTDDNGKIKPILGYNATDNFDYVRYNMCLLRSMQANPSTKAKANPFWSYSLWAMLAVEANSVCQDTDFIYPSLDTSSLSADDYIITDVVGSIASGPITDQLNATSATLTKVPGFDAWGKSIGLIRKKLYVTTTVDEKFIYLDPVNLRNPKILINAPGITLNSSSSQYSQDPNKTVIANIAIEDLAVYLKATNIAAWDYEWIRFMLSYVSPVIGPDRFMVGSFGGTENKSANFVTLVPKAAHPFFAGIPIKSNVYTYGPWTNYPYLEHLADPNRVFPPGKTISQSKTIPPVCVEQPSIIDNATAQRAIDNWVVPTNIEVRDDFVPWNYGGCSFLDSVAISEVETKINYQNILETAQIDMVGLPMFDLGGAFSFGNINVAIPSNALVSNSYSYTDIKNSPTPLSDLADSPLGSILNLVANTDAFMFLKYSTLQLNTKNLYVEGPIITNIQVSISQQGLTTTYTFRTYTKKLGLFNKENSDRVKFSFNENMKRNKQLATINQQSINQINSQKLNFESIRRGGSYSFNSKDVQSKLYGWSPSLVLVGKSYPWIQATDRDPEIIGTKDFMQQKFNTASSVPVTKQRKPYIIPSSKDTGDTKDDKKTIKLTDGSSIVRNISSVGLFERKELDSELTDDYALKSAMSLDGLLSPISFYPTLKGSTYSMSLYERQACPFCTGAGTIETINLSWAQVEDKEGGPKNRYIQQQVTGIYVCLNCTDSSQRLNASLKGSSQISMTYSSEILPPYIVSDSSSLSLLLEFNPLLVGIKDVKIDKPTMQESEIPINLTSLNPIVIPYGEFRNVNAVSGDRQRHNIEIIGRGAVPPGFIRRNIEISKNLNNYISSNINSKNVPELHNPDFYHKDVAWHEKVGLVPKSFEESYDMNQRFMGLRGPLNMHGWGYDTEGFPVPNAADEPKEVNPEPNGGQPKRFKQHLQTLPKPITFLEMKVGDIMYKQSSGGNSVGDATPKPPPSVLVLATKSAVDDTIEEEMGKIFTKTLILKDGYYIYAKTWEDHVNILTYKDYINGYKYYEEGSPSFASNNYQTRFNQLRIIDSLTDRGGFDAIKYKGSIISKSQDYIDGKWTTKKKLNQFYKNWAEKPNLWPVGPLDLRWDETRRVWTMNDNHETKIAIYKFVYVTLEEDLVKEDDFDETYPARGFLDDIQYSKLPLRGGQFIPGDNNSSALDDNFRKLVYVKDRTGYTAPRGVKLLCRYDSDTGFYEPISKPSIIVPGSILDATSCIIEMHYVQGRQKGEIPTIAAQFSNLLQLDIALSTTRRGMFNYVGNGWSLLALGK